MSDGLPTVLLGDAMLLPVKQLLARFGVTLQLVADGLPIEASYWGEPEAGLVGSQVYARLDTPVHSVLHEAAHILCMDVERRARLYKDAGGDFAEEDAVCCLQIMLAEQIPALGAERMMQDMDAWGYTFRLGSARAFFSAEAAQAREYLQKRGLTNADGQLQNEVQYI
jgi:hypothetical protein